MSSRRSLVIIDPAVHTPELDCFNHIASLTALPVSYHLPAMFGFRSLERLDLQAVAGIIILGSAASVHNIDKWQPKLKAWLSPLLAAATPALGLCFGHQLIGHMFDAKVAFLFPDHRKLKGFREISLKTDPLWGTTKVGPVTVSHAEAVTTCPPQFKVVGTSQDLEIEAMAHQALPIWTFQSHPEATPIFLNNHQIDMPTTHNPLAFGQVLVQNFIDFSENRARVPA